MFWAEGTPAETVKHGEPRVQQPWDREELDGS